MAKIKHTKNELKVQRESLKRFERFLPMLVLKKQQLQSEIQAIEAKLAELEEQDAVIRSSLAPWISLLSEEAGMSEAISIESVVLHEGNIAGINIPVLDKVSLKKSGYDLYTSPSWLDDAVSVMEQLMTTSIAKRVLTRQKELISEELRVTTQRVNLFEKIKIPECKKNIRVIKIFLGDEQTAAVARGKNAKKRTAA